MAINSGRLVVDPVTEVSRPKLREVTLAISSTRPPGYRTYIDPVNGVSIEPQIPRWEGEILLFQDTANDRNILMVVVEINSELIWKEVRTTLYYVDGLTGEEFRSL